MESRVAEPLKLRERLRAWSLAGGVWPQMHANAPAMLPELSSPPTRLQWLWHRAWHRLVRLKVPRGTGVTAASVIMLGGLAFGVVRGGHLPEVADAFADLRDQAANAVGFRIVNLAVTGHDQLTREEVLAAARLTGRSSLLFLDAEATRERLKSNPWIAEATVRKLLPGALQIEIRERAPFALWQKDRRFSVIADDGTVLEQFVAPQNLALPLVVGEGAERHAKEFLALLDRYPEIFNQVRASIRVGNRRWTLRLRNGMDVRLHESDAASALDRLVALDRERQLLGRDIVAVDLRLSDRVTVRLSERAAQAREQQLKDSKKRKKAGRG
jgi:cell division protein FtsQ